MKDFLNIEHIISYNFLTSYFFPPSLPFVSSTQSVQSSSFFFLLFSFFLSSLFLFSFLRLIKFSFPFLFLFSFPNKISSPDPVLLNRRPSYRIIPFTLRPHSLSSLVLLSYYIFRLYPVSYLST